MAWTSGGCHVGLPNISMGGPLNCRSLPSVGMTKGRAVLPLGIGSWDGRNSRSLTSLRFGRDDKGEGGASIGDWFVGSTEQQVPPLRYASVGMTILWSCRFYEVRVSFRSLTAR
jgi:hypothetical protein